MTTPIKIRVSSFTMVAAKATLGDKIAQILADYKRSGSSYLPPKDFDFLLRNLDFIEDEEPLDLIRKNIKQTGLPEKWQKEYIKKDGDIAVDTLPDVGAEAQEYIIKRDINVPALIDKIPNLTKASASLLKVAVNSEQTSEVTIRFMLHRYFKELTGLNLRRKALLKYPKLVFILPSGVNLTLAEKKELVEADPETIKAFNRKEPSLIKLYNQITKGEMQVNTDVDEEAELANATKMKDLIDQLNDARLAGDELLVTKLTNQITEVKKLLDSALNQESSKKDKDMKEEPKVEADAKKLVSITRNDLTGFVVVDPTSGEKHTILSHMHFTDVGDLPESVSRKLSSYLSAMNFEPSHFLRLRKAGAASGQPLTHLLATQEGLTGLKIVSKLTNDLLDGMIQAERVTNWNKILKVVDSKFDQVTPKAAPPTAVRTAPADDDEPIMPEGETFNDSGKHKGIDGLSRFFKQLVSLKKTVDRTTLSAPQAEAAK